VWWRQVEPISPCDLQGLCAQAGFDSRVVDHSAVTLGLFHPPQQMVNVTDWERIARLRYALASHKAQGGSPPVLHSAGEILSKSWEKVTSPKEL
jgi:hypothetical protein